MILCAELAKNFAQTIHKLLFCKNYIINTLIVIKPRLITNNFQIRNIFSFSSIFLRIFIAAFGISNIHTAFTNH